MISKEYNERFATVASKTYEGCGLEYRKYPLKCCDTNVAIDFPTQSQILNFFIQCNEIQGKITIKQQGFDFFKDPETNKYYMNVSEDAFNPVEENCYLLLLAYKK